MRSCAILGDRRISPFIARISSNLTISSIGGPDIDNRRPRQATARTSSIDGCRNRPLLGRLIFRVAASEKLRNASNRRSTCRAPSFDEDHRTVGQRNFPPALSPSVRNIECMTFVIHLLYKCPTKRIATTIDEARSVKKCGAPHIGSPQNAQTAIAKA